MAPRPRIAHEHGLRERLIDSSIALLSDGRPLTLRGAAAHAGVSHAAPAHHFAGLAGLETAVAGRAFRVFTRQLQEAASRQTEVHARILAVAQEYCDFAVDHHALFQLMFVSDRVDHTAPELADAQDEAYRVLRAVCAPVLPRPDDAALVETTLWAIVHGYAMLHHRRPAGHTPVPAPSLDQVLGHALACETARATLLAQGAPSREHV